MFVELLSFSQDGNKIVELAARSTRGNYEESKNTPIDYGYIEKIVASDHLSILEHFACTFRIEGISRACSHQFVRHRIGVSYTQESQRYVTISDENEWYVVPPSIIDNAPALELYKQYMKEYMKQYNKLIEKGVPIEDARFVLPNACKTSMIFSANARSLFHLFDLRICSRAQWEIRALSIQMYEILLNKFPGIFLLWKPRCARGCPERCNEPINALVNQLKTKYRSD